VVPTCAVSKAVGDEIRGAIKNARHLPVVGTGTVWIEMNFNTAIQKGSIYNVIGDVKGGGGPDGGPFMKRGTEGCLAMGEWGSSWEYHTQWDTIDHVNKESWAVGGMLLGSLALHLAA